MKILMILSVMLTALFTICCFYQAVFALVRLLGKQRTYSAKKLCRYAVLIAARNEETVIGHLIDSLKKQDYPAELVDIYVVADNCTDDTYGVAKGRGINVYRRNNNIKVGKGYALQFLLDKIKEEHSDRHYDGYFVFDADNILEPDYITEMNKAFSSGNAVVTGYRNTKNYGDNWITAGYGIYFMRESEYLNRSRDYMGLSSFVSGTGYVFADRLLKRAGGWSWFALTEDLEFTADMVAQGERVAYCHNAVLYDEQPSDFTQSVLQRSRWIKGFFQVMKLRGASLVKSLFRTGSFSCYDLLMTLAPFVLTVVGAVLNTAMFVVGMAGHKMDLELFTFMALQAGLGSYLTLYALGAMTLITENKRIRCPREKKIMYSFTFPVFIFTFLIATLHAGFAKAKWHPIKHTVSVSIEELEKA